jgi:hypothetical protein
MFVMFWFLFDVCYVLVFILCLYSFGFYFVCIVCYVFYVLVFILFV